MIDDASRLRLEHMLEHARLAVEILGVATSEDLSANPEKRLAIVRAVEVIGEAANRVAPGVRATFASIPWRDIVTMRNRLIHGYSIVDLGRVVLTVNGDIPPLIAELERILNDGAQGQT